MIPSLPYVMASKDDSALEIMLTALLMLPSRPI
jgi:hypothetical protein